MAFPSPVLPPPASPSPVPYRSGKNRALVIALAALVVAFALPLMDLVRLSTQSDLFSHIILIPFVSVYLVWLRRGELPAPSAPDRRFVIGAAAGGVVALAAYAYLTRSGAVLAREDRLALLIFAFFAFVIGACAAFLGRRTLVALSFPLGFLVFLVPFPLAVIDAIETFFQHTSAVAAAGFFSIAGTPFFREDTFFQLPGINLEVAPECSGIRSSLALFITSLVAGQLFLRSAWKRVILVLVIVPLGIVRNGLRIFVIGELCVRISPEMIDSYIHRQGGPIFFALSLIPFSLFLFLLVRSDRAKTPLAAIVPSPAPSAH